MRRVSKSVRPGQTKEALALGDLMLHHLSLTYSEMKSTVRGQETESLAYYQEIQRCATEMSRAISDAIAAL